MTKQKTIQNEIQISGVGLHTGNKVNLKFKPGKENEGIVFIRTDLPDRPHIEAKPVNVIHNAAIPRCTSIGKSNHVIHTVEHLMAALWTLGITNLVVEIDGNELPGLDGSSIEYIKNLRQAKVVEQSADSVVFSVRESCGVAVNGASIFVFPDDEFKVSYSLSYDQDDLSGQFVQFSLTPEIFEKEIAPARTFCLESEANELRQRGLGKGANYTNTLVIGKNGVIENKLRFPDEFARHKMLDLVGDLYLFGIPIKGHVYAVKSGHNLNLGLLKKLVEQKERVCKKGITADFCVSGKKELNIQDIMKILPHRYPFLLVDRFVFLENGQGVGIKNVSMNEPFFEGHFPTRPVMPGVLMLEAMAQAAGIYVLTQEKNRGKVAFFMAADKVKFRKVVTAGDQLIMEPKMIRDRDRTVQLSCQAKVNNEVVVEAEMMFSFTDVSYLD